MGEPAAGRGVHGSYYLWTNSDAPFAKLHTDENYWKIFKNDVET